MVVAFHAATLATGRALPLTRTGLSPVGTRQLSWRTNGWPMRSPVNASPASSQMPPHDSGASVVRYTFTARDFHSLLFAGFTGAPEIKSFRKFACPWLIKGLRLPKDMTESDL